MAYRAFGVRLAFLFGFAFLIVLMQFLAVSRLNAPVQYPWQVDDGQEGRAVKKVERTEQSLPLEHENPGAINRIKVVRDGGREILTEMRSDRTKDNDSKPSSLPRVPMINNLRTLQERLMNKLKVKNSTFSQSEERVSVTTHMATTEARNGMVMQETKTIPSLMPMPLPEVLQNCDTRSKKDAESAISRAKTDECKSLIRNVTCLGQAGRLYNVDIKNTCPVGRNPGKNFEHRPHSWGIGPPARVVFLLSVHGRAFRQVKRLFKVIYHTDHYFFVHVDSRSDYLHRKLYEALSDFPNVYFPTWRMATIWGGASLLQMLLRSMEDLENVLTDWKWDYLINLSESDFPLQSNDELVKFLRTHRGSNFVKTHGGDIKKFIQKQGLDRTFVECDNHMWRVDNRPLPPDITVDGGSDWIAITRNYSRYLVTSQDSLLTGLKRYYEFSLLPAESFFHTVIRNGPMCETFVKTNLRITNWNRKLGCRCQYKHIVDWCGCSPNDFLTRDFSRIKNPGEHHFFARKFESIVNQEIINLMDSHLYGKYPQNTPAFRSYWESVFHVDDDITKPSNARYSTYQSFLRQSIKLLYANHSEQTVGNDGGEEKGCGIPKQAVVKDVSVLKRAELITGLVVTLKDALSAKLNPPEFEVYFTPEPMFKRHTLENELSRRIWALEIGSDWDGKESVFRNYGGILGAWDEPMAAVRLTTGRMGDVNIVWEDPVGEKIGTSVVKLEAGWFVATHKPRVDRPIRPGVWSAKLQLLDGTVILETRFLVVPITHENMEPLNNPQSVNARRADAVRPGMDSREYAKWRANVVKSGTDLEQWMDELVGEFWHVEGYCRTEMKGGECPGMTDCASRYWSTFSPDPKSEITNVQDNGRIR